MAGIGKLIEPVRHLATIASEYATCAHHRCKGLGRERRLSVRAREDSDLSPSDLELLCERLF